MNNSNLNVTARNIATMIVAEFPTVTVHSIVAIGNNNSNDDDIHNIEKRDYGVYAEFRLSYGMLVLRNFAIPDELYPLVCVELFGSENPSYEDKCIFKLDNKISLEDYTEVAQTISFPKGFHTRAQMGWAKHGGESPIYYRCRFYKRYKHRRNAVKRGELGDKAKYGIGGHSKRW